MEGIMETAEQSKTCVVDEHDMTVGNTKFHVKSVFTDKIKLGDALKNIAMKKQRESSLPKAG